VRLHIITASLGVSIGYDFLANIFNQSPMSTPSSEYDYLRELAGSSVRVPIGTPTKIQLGTFISAASQLPLLLMRKHEYVNLMVSGEQIDSSVLSFRDGEAQAWILFNDVIRVLSAKTKALFMPSS
jgi:hypothetical protein